MRFRAPRSDSPSPVRQGRKRSAFGCASSDEDEGSASSHSDTESVASSSSSDSFCYESESEVPPPPPKPQRIRSEEEQWLVEETTASIRMRTRHRDPYEEWEKKTKEDSFMMARKNHLSIRTQRHKDQSKAQEEQIKRLDALHQKQMEEVEARLSNLQMQHKAEEEKLRERWKLRDKLLWERIEASIKLEEEKLKAREEAERLAREEEEKKKREEEERIRLEEEKKRKEEEEERLKKEQKEEDEKKRIEKEGEERKEREKDEEMRRVQAEMFQQEDQERQAMGMTTAEDDWKYAREVLRNLKTGPIATVKANMQLKNAWANLRREITPKIGQLTNDAEEVDRISRQLVDIIRPTQPHPPELYYACLSSLAKAIILQSETEVTADKKSTAPIVLVSVNMLANLDGFADIFWAKLCQRCGGWPVPFIVPLADFDGTPFTGETRKKAMGLHDDESPMDFSLRVSGIMRVYFSILFEPVRNPLGKLFQLPQYWIYFARMLNDPAMSGNSVAPAMMHTALEVGGVEARDIFGQQWIKLLEALYEAVTTGPGGLKDRIIGGDSPEGIASRVRVQSEVERIMSSP